MGIRRATRQSARVRCMCIREAPRNGPSRHTSRPRTQTLPICSAMLSASAADGNTMAVSAYDEDGGSRTINGPHDHARRGSGAIYVFKRTGAMWAPDRII